MRLRSPVVGLLALLAAGPALAQSESKPEVVFGFAIDGPWEDNGGILREFQSELRSLLASDYRVSFPADKTLTGDFSPEAVRNNLDALLRDPDVDIVFAMGLEGSADAVRRPELPKPVIAPFIIDGRAQGAPRRERASGVRNLTYLECPSTLQRELRSFLDIHPFQHLVFLTSGFFVDEMTRLTENVVQVAQGMGIALTVVPVVGSADSVLAAIPADADAAYLAALQQLDPGQYGPLIHRLHARHIPTFSLLGRRDVERGVFAGLSSGEWFARLARRCALDAQRILDGEDAGTLPVDISRREELVINMAAARELGIYPSYRILTEAVLLNQDRGETGRTLGLVDAVREALDANRDLQASGLELDAAGNDVARARSNWLPQVDADATGAIIDEDRAAASFGSAPERSIWGGLSATQLLWSETAAANLAIQRRLQHAREGDYESGRLDVVQSAAGAYLNLLRAKTYEDIERENLKLSRSNLEVAQIRQTIGVTGPAEVYRWQSQIALEQKATIEANAARNLAEIELNRVLHRPLEEPFTTTEPKLDDPALMPADPRFLAAFADPWSFRTFRAFMAGEAVHSSPEIAALDANISAQERLAASARNAFYSPTLGLSGEIRHRFAEGGAGTEDLSGIIPGFTPLDDTEWNVGLRLSLPLTNGGDRIAVLRQSRAELDALRTRRQALAERIEQAVRSALHRAGASHAGIALARESADAAARNLDLVQDAYSQGSVQIIDLLDAQNAGLTASQTAANAVYDFLLDLVDVERAMGRFFFLAGPDERAAWFDRLESYFEEARKEP